MDSRALNHYVYISCVLNEPLGGVFYRVTPAGVRKDSRAVLGRIIMEPEDTLPMSGSNSICVAIVLLGTRSVEVRESETQ